MPSNVTYAAAEYHNLFATCLKLREAGATQLNHYCNMSLQASSKYCLAKAPKLVEIMNAVPEEFKSILIPQ